MYEYKKIKLKDGTTRDEHRLIMEKQLGRKLKRNEVVHHINGDKKDNRIENLEVINRSIHSRQHMRGNKLSEETKEKLSKKHRSLYVEGKIINKLSIKLKMSETNDNIEKKISCIFLSKNNVYDIEKSKKVVIKSTTKLINSNDKTDNFLSFDK